MVSPTWLFVLLFGSGAEIMANNVYSWVTRLDEVRECINGRVKIVLHGTNGFGEDVMMECVRHGTTKINLNKLVLQDYLDHLKDQAGKVTLTQLMEEGVEKAQKLLEWQMDVCGSTGKA